MKKASYVIEPYYQKNACFDLSDKVKNRDGAMYFAWALRNALAKRGYDLQTDDIHSPHDSEIAIYADMPRYSAPLPRPENRSKSYLIAFESELILKSNWLPENQQRFHTVFTWHDELIAKNASTKDPRATKFVKSNFTFKLPKGPLPKPFSERKLITLISGNKAVRHPLELYSARRDFIRWAEAHIPSDFEYYGIGWEWFYLRGGFFHKVLRKLGLLKYMPKSPSRCYRGKVVDKFPVLEGYRFSLCFENGRDIPGYITEKIFDSMIAGCVPVYWGANNIADHIPADCFIDYRQFASRPNPHRELVDYLRAMPESRWQEYQNAIRSYFNSEKAKAFDADAWAEMVASHVTSN